MEADGCDFTGTYLGGADLARANLSGADPREANLDDVDLSALDLRGAKLDVEGPCCRPAASAPRWTVSPYAARNHRRGAPYISVRGEPKEAQ